MHIILCVITQYFLLGGSGDPCAAKSIKFWTNLFYNLESNHWIFFPVGLNLRLKIGTFKGKFEIIRAEISCVILKQCNYYAYFEINV